MRLTVMASVMLLVCTSSSFSGTLTTKDIHKQKRGAKTTVPAKAIACVAPKNMDLPQETFIQRGLAFTPPINPAQYLKNIEELKYTAIKSNPVHIMSIDQPIESSSTTIGLKRTTKAPYHTVALHITYPVSVFQTGSTPCIWDLKNDVLVEMLSPVLKASSFGLHAELFLPKQALHNALRFNQNTSKVLNVLEGTVDNPVLELSYTAPPKKSVAIAMKPAE